MIKIIKNSNNRILTSNIFGSFFYKTFTLAIGFLLTPAYIRYFDNYVMLGVWFTLISIMAWVFNFDMGIGNGLRSNLVEPLLKKDEKKITELISSAYVILAVIMIPIIIIGSTLILIINWNILLNISSTLISENDLKITIIVLFIGIMIQFWLKIIFSILYAMQKTALPNFITLISNILLYLFLTICNFGNLNDKIIFLSLCYILVVNIPLLIFSYIIFKKNRIIVSYKFYRKKYIKDIMLLGGLFFYIQVGLMLILSTNDIIISTFYSPIYVVDFQIYNKWFNLFVVLFSLLSQPIWSAFSNAYKEKRFLWIFKVYKLFNLLALVGTLGCIFLALMFQMVVNAWLGENTINVDNKTLIYFVLVSSLLMFINASTSVANAFNKLKCQVICVSIGVMIKIILLLSLSTFITDWSIIIAITVISLIPLFIAQPISTLKMLKKNV